MNIFKKIDFLFFGFLIVTSILLLFSWNQSSNSLSLLLTRMAISIGVILLIYLNSKTKSTLINLIRNSYGIILSGYFYSETVHYNKLFFSNLDDNLLNLDAQLFGFQPSIIFSDYFSNSFFSELMYFGYFSFYLLIIGFLFVTFFKLKNYADALIFKLTASMFIFYIFFGLFPSAGPQFHFLAPEKNLPTAFIFDKIMHFIQTNAEQPTAAFPSSHVGISIIILILSRKILPLFYKVSIPFVLILILSTVYIKAHYAVDVLGGIIISPFVLYVATVLYKAPFFKKLNIIN